jgi:hypothetical protein
LIVEAPVPPPDSMTSEYSVPCTRYFASESLAASSSKTRMNSGPDRLALGLRVGDAVEALEEALLGVDRDQRDVELVAEGLDDLLALVLAHEAVVDEDAGQLLADRLVDQQRRDARVHAARQAADDLPVADLLADAGDLLLDDARRRPGHVALAHVAQEGLEDLLAVRGVDDLGWNWMPYIWRSVDSNAATGDWVDERERREAAARCRPCRGATSSSLVVRQALEEDALLAHGQLGAAELADLGALDLAAERQGRRAACRSRCPAPGSRARAARDRASGAPSAYTDAGRRRVSKSDSLT